MTSVSEVDWKIEPAASSSWRRIVALTRLPLWPMAIGPRWHSMRYGCAFEATVSPEVE